MGLSAKEAKGYTPSQASVELTIALFVALGFDLARKVIGDEAVGYLARWGHAVTFGDKARVRLLEEDMNGKQFMVIVDTLMPAVKGGLVSIAESAEMSGPGVLRKGDMEAMEKLISIESANRAKGREDGPEAEVSSHGGGHGPFGDCSYC